MGSRHLKSWFVIIEGNTKTPTLTRSRMIQKIIKTKSMQTSVLFKLLIKIPLARQDLQIFTKSLIQWEIRESPATCLNYQQVWGQVSQLTTSSVTTLGVCLYYTNIENVDIYMLQNIINVLHSVGFICVVLLFVFYIW